MESSSKQPTPPAEPGGAAPSAPRTLKQLREALKRSELELALVEAHYATNLLQQLTVHEQSNVAAEDPDAANWQLMSQGGKLVAAKDLAELQSRDVVRKQSYRAWRLDSHAHGILRTFEKFILGRGFGVDFLDEQRGEWQAEERDPKARVKITQREEDPLATRLIWDEFVELNRFDRRAKEIVRRAFRDGEVFIRRFKQNRRVFLRFIEPEQVQTNRTEGLPAEIDGVAVKTKITDGIEHLDQDVETVTAYWVGETRIPAADVLHIKPLADSNDMRGIPLLEVVLRRLKNYETWEDYRMILNKARTAIALVRKIEGASSTQAANLISQRQPARGPIEGREPQTDSGRREAAFRPGTILTPAPGVSYDFVSAKLDARDASEDGRRFLLSIAAGVSLPEMLVTADYSNANFASTVEAGTPAVREWEDWQDFFEPEFETIIRWVLAAAIEAKRLPAETDVRVKLQWPPLIYKDATKETERHATLHGAGLISKTTWAAREGFVYDDEQEQLRAEGEQASALEAPEAPEDRVQEAHAALIALGELEEAVGGHESPEVHEKFQQYVDTARALLFREARQGSKVQSLIFDPKRFTVAQAKQWAKQHGYKMGKVDKSDTEIRLRQLDPSKWTVVGQITLRPGVKATVAREAEPEDADAH